MEYFRPKTAAAAAVEAFVDRDPDTDWGTGKAERFY